MKLTNQQILAQKKPRHIALYSSTPQQGKSTVASFLEVTHGYKKISFASPVLEMVETFLTHQGMSMDAIDFYCRTAKEEEIPCVGYSYRYLARTIGTEWGRRLVGELIWLKAFSQKFLRFSLKQQIVNDDLRFINELEFLRELGFITVKIVRPTDRPSGLDTHQSDVDLAYYDEWDYILDNSGTIEDLYQTINREIV